jgi:hypothetical protein
MKKKVNKRPLNKVAQSMILVCHQSDRLDSATFPNPSPGTVPSINLKIGSDHEAAYITKKKQYRASVLVHQA